MYYIASTQLRVSCKYMYLRSHLAQVDSLKILLVSVYTLHTHYTHVNVQNKYLNTNGMYVLLIHITRGHGLLIIRFVKGQLACSFDTHLILATAIINTHTQGCQEHIFRSTHTA